MEFFKFFIRYVASKLAVPFWVVGHIHLTMNTYDNLKTIMMSLGINLLVFRGSLGGTIFVRVADGDQVSMAVLAQVVAERTRPFGQSGLQSAFLTGRAWGGDQQLQEFQILGGTGNHSITLSKASRKSAAD